MAKNGVGDNYDKDPKTYKDAVRFDIITLNELQEKKLQVMDLTASNVAMPVNVNIIFLY